MAYGHAERILAAIRVLEAETAELLWSLPQLDDEQSGWLDELAAAGSQRARRAGWRLLQGGLTDDLSESRPLEDVPLGD